MMSREKKEIEKRNSDDFYPELQGWIYSTQLPELLIMRFSGENDYRVKIPKGTLNYGVFYEDYAIKSLNSIYYPYYFFGYTYRINYNNPPISEDNLYDKIVMPDFEVKISDTNYQSTYSNFAHCGTFEERFLRNFSVDLSPNHKLIKLVVIGGLELGDAPNKQMTSLWADIYFDGAKYKRIVSREKIGNFGEGYISGSGYNIYQYSVFELDAEVEIPNGKSKLEIRIGTTDTRYGELSGVAMSSTNGGKFDVTLQSVQSSLNYFRYVPELNWSADVIYLNPSSDF